MKEIPLTQGQVALVDDEDYEKVSQYNWFAEKSRNTYYALSHPGYKNRIKVRMHRLVMDCSEGMFVDHIDGNGLNNQKSNLRICTHRQNTQNKHIEKTSIYPGVHWVNKLQKWQAHIQLSGKIVYLGVFKNEIDAFRAYYDEVLKIGEEVMGFSYPFAPEGKNDSYLINRYPKHVMGINLTNPDDVIYFESMSDAHRKGGFCIQAISLCCKGKAKTHRGYQWQIVNFKEDILDV
jgi:hypothetical protein